MTLQQSGIFHFSLPKPHIFLCRIILKNNILLALWLLTRNVPRTRESEKATSTWKCHSLSLILRSFSVLIEMTRLYHFLSVNTASSCQSKNWTQWNCPGTFPGCSCDNRPTGRGEPIDTKGEQRKTQWRSGK